jgi:hypothetical protein
MFAQLMREDIPVSKRMNGMVNTDKEYMAGLKYIVGKILGSAHYDSDMGLGFGVNLNY